MGLSSRYYLFAEDGVHRIAKRVVDGLVQGIDALPNYASTTQKAAAVTIENDAKGGACIIHAVGEFWHFDEVGKINKSLQQAAWGRWIALLPLFIRSRSRCRSERKAQAKAVGQGTSMAIVEGGP